MHPLDAGTVGGRNACQERVEGWDAAQMASPPPDRRIRPGSGNGPAAPQGCEPQESQTAPPQCIGVGFLHCRDADAAVGCSRPRPKLPAAVATRRCGEERTASFAFPQKANAAAHRLAWSSLSQASANLRVRHDIHDWIGPGTDLRANHRAYGHRPLQTLKAGRPGQPSG